MKKIVSTLLAVAMAMSSISSAMAAGGPVCEGLIVTATAPQSSASSGGQAKTVAFPGAEGGGMYAKGARAAAKQEVYHVTNLNDSGKGSFRDAVSRSGRFVVFDVSGMIDLSSNVTIKSNTTVLGQTAPGDGICFRGNNVKISGENIIVRYVRFRVGSHLADGSDTRTQDGLEVTDNARNIIIDHCSVSWGTDENLSAYAVENLTIQNSIIAEALNQSIHAKGEHSYGGIWGGVNMSVHHNLIATHKSRNPRIGSSETVAMTAGYTDSEALVDMRNNVIYNWGDKAGYGAENGTNVNIINNYYKPGPSTPSNKRARIFELSPGVKYQDNWSGSIYADGNIIGEDSADAALVNENNWQIDKKMGVYLDASTKIYNKLDEPDDRYIRLYPITTTSAEEAYDYVLENAGARLPKLDIVDARIIEDVKNGTAPNGSSGSIGLLDEPTDGIPEGDEALYDDRGYPIWVSETRADDYDTDLDGIPDEWEDKMGLNKENPNDSLNKAYDSYTWLEVYGETLINTDARPFLDVDKTDITLGETISYPMAEGQTMYLDGESIAPEWNGYQPPAGEHTLVGVGFGIEGYDAIVSNAVTIRVSDGENYLANNQSTATTMDGDYKLVSKINPSNLVKEVPSYIYAGDYAVGCGYDENYKKKIYFGTKDALDVSDLNADEYTLFKIENVNGMLGLYAGKSLAEWTLLEEHPSDDSMLTVGKAVGDGEMQTVTEFSDTYYITAETSPKVAITNYADGDRIGYNESLELALTPDGADISQVMVYFNGELIASQNVSGTSAIVPISFSQIASGTIKVECIDTNLCIGTDEIEVYVSADLTPWKIADIGDVDSKTFVSVTNDYTYKINAPQGYIGNTEDAFGFVYQKFTGDNRIYYRSRMQSGSQFGIMLRSSLEPDADMYWFGGEYNADGAQKLKYHLKHRVAGAPEAGYSYENGVVNAAVADGVVAVAVAYDENGRMTAVKTAEFKDGKAEVGEVSGAKLFALKSLESLEPVSLGSIGGGTNGETVMDYTLDNQNPNLYFIAEKAGNKLNIYQTENGSTVYTTKNLLTSIDCSALGSTYYMGFAVTGGAENNPPDAGWVAVDNNSGDNKYSWTFDSGLDWLWQMQEREVLEPLWTNVEIASVPGGKMMIVPGDEYTSGRYVFREYITDDALMPEMSADVYLTGDSPAMNVYFQTGESSKAYKVVLSTEEGDIPAVSTGVWYNVNIRTDVSADGTVGYLTIASADGEVVVENLPIYTVMGTEFRTQINTAKKTPVTKAVYFEPAVGAEGTYYVDNVSVTANEPSMKVTKIQSWYTFEDMEIATFTKPIAIAGTTTALGADLSGEEATISAGEVKEGNKTIDGVKFTNKLRIKGTTKKFTVPVSNGALVSVYASSASSSSTRPLFIDGVQYDLLEAVKSEYTYTGDADTIEIYAGDNIDVYGISVVQTIIE